MNIKKDILSWDQCQLPSDHQIAIALSRPSLLPNCNPLYTMAQQDSTPPRLALSTKELICCSKTFEQLIHRKTFFIKLFFDSYQLLTDHSQHEEYVHYGTGSNINTFISLSWRVGARQEHFSDQSDVDCLVELLCAWAWAPLRSDDCCWCQLLGCLYTKVSATWRNNFCSDVKLISWSCTNLMVFAGMQLVYT